MSFTRYHYDLVRSRKQLQELTDQGRWILNTPGNGINPYYYEDPHIRLEKWGGNVSSGNVVDNMSDLDGRNRVLNHEGATYKKNENPSEYKKKSYPNFKPYTNETRVTHPAMMYRDLSQTRWEYPLFDPQEHAYTTFLTDISTRIVEKTNYKPKV